MSFFSEVYGLLLIALSYALGIALVSVMIYFATSYFENKKQKERERLRLIREEQNRLKRAREKELEEQKEESGRKNTLKKKEILLRK